MNKSYNLRLGSLWADAFRGHGLSLLEKPTLRGLRTRAIPAGVTARHSPRLVWCRLLMLFYNFTISAVVFCSKQQYINNKNTVCSNTSGGKTWRLLWEEGLDETPPCGSTRRLISRPRKAKCFSEASKRSTLLLKLCRSLHLLPNKTPKFNLPRLSRRLLEVFWA